jgi:hypothetical protein
MSEHLQYDAQSDKCEREEEKKKNCLNSKPFQIKKMASHHSHPQNENEKPTSFIFGSSFEKWKQIREKIRMAKE